MQLEESAVSSMTRIAGGLVAAMDTELEPLHQARQKIQEEKKEWYARSPSGDGLLLLLLPSSNISICSLSEDSLLDDFNDAQRLLHFKTVEVVSLFVNLRQTLDDDDVDKAMPFSRH
tara:strand:- start:385 stop:735 length:351 start_codon:yes stop_codon:yes gene_type:complete